MPKPVIAFEEAGFPRKHCHFWEIFFHFFLVDFTSCYCGYLWWPILITTLGELVSILFPFFPAYIMDVIRKEGFQQPTIIQAQVFLHVQGFICVEACGYHSQSG